MLGQPCGHSTQSGLNVAMSISKICLCAAAFVFSLAPAGAAQAGLSERGTPFQTFPECDDAKVLKKIVKRFNWAERNTWRRGFSLETVEDPRERSVREYEESLIPRRYCRGHAILTNGQHPTVFYLIEGGQGFTGTGFNVEFCVNGIDPWREYDGHCRVLRY